MANNKKGSAKAIPIIRERIIKNPQTLFPVNWEEILDEGQYWYEDEPIFDKFDNCTTKRNLYIVQKEIKGFRKPRKKGINLSVQKPLFALKGDDKSDES